MTINTARFSKFDLLPEKLKVKLLMQTLCTSVFSNQAIHYRGVFRCWSILAFLQSPLRAMYKLMNERETFLSCVIANEVVRDYKSIIEALRAKGK